MADFCTNCAKKLNHPIPEIDVIVEASEILPNHYKDGYLCEGCGIVAIGNLDGEVYVGRVENTEIIWDKFSNQ